VNAALPKGISVVQGDIDEDLPYYADCAYDYVLCVKTLQATSHPHKVLEQLVRVGKQVIVSVPNFGYLPHRLHLGIKGRMPMSKNLSYQWYETPNIHFCTLTDFVELCEAQKIVIQQRYARYASGTISRFSGYGSFANIFAEEGIFLLEASSS
jgi:methionine biosynthesis protein MetW